MSPYHLREMPTGLLWRNESRVARVDGRFWRGPARRGIWRLPGFGILAHCVGRRKAVWRLPAALEFEPLYWCVRARAQGRVP